MKNMLLSYPRDCYLILTDHCNMRCRHCYGRYGINAPSRELSGAEWINIIKELSRNNVFFVNISGGEPTLHPDFCEILTEINNEGMLYLLTTNGLFSEKTLNSIIQSKNCCLGVKISLDGIDEESFCFLRRDVNGKVNPKFLDVILSNITKLINANIPITIATCLHPKNIQKIAQMKDFIIKLKPVNWYISTISLSGSARDNDIFISESVLSKKFWISLQKDCKKVGTTVSFVDMPSLIKSKTNRSIYFNCPAARSFCEIYSDGTVSPCPLSRIHIPENDLPKENILNKSMKKIWNGKSFKKFRAMQHKGCKGCKMIKRCDRCVPQSYQWFNDPAMPPPYCVSEAKSLKLKQPDKLMKKLRMVEEEFNRRNYCE